MATKIKLFDLSESNSNGFSIISKPSETKKLILKIIDKTWTADPILIWVDPPKNIFSFVDNKIKALEILEVRGILLDSDSTHVTHLNKIYPGIYSKNPTYLVDYVSNLKTRVFEHEINRYNMDTQFKDGNLIFSDKNKPKECFIIYDAVDSGIVNIANGWETKLEAFDSLKFKTTQGDFKTKANGVIQHYVSSFELIKPKPITECIWKPLQRDHKYIELCNNNILDKESKLFDVIKSFGNHRGKKYKCPYCGLPIKFEGI